MNLHVTTKHLLITNFDMEMCQAVHLNSLDEDTRRFVPDEVFETLEEAQQTVAFLMESGKTQDGPHVHPVLRDGVCIGYVQLCRETDGFEVGYHIAANCTGRGYATEALQAFLPAAMRQLSLKRVSGVVLQENHASRRVLEKCGFKLVFQGMADYQGRKQPVLRYEYEMESQKRLL